MFANLLDALVRFPSISLLFFSLLLFSCIAFLLYIHRVRSLSHLRISSLEKSLADLDSLLTALRIQTHDYKHHLHYIQSQIETASTLPELRHILHQYLKPLDTSRSYLSMLQSINQPVFRSLLYGAYIRCEKESIPFSFHASSLLPSFPLQDYQLVTVLENLISNAIEHNLTLPLAQRSLSIALQASVHEKSILNEFSITNPFIPSSDVPPSLSAIGYTSKKSARHQGLGLVSISQTLHKASLPFCHYIDPVNHTITFSFSYILPKEN